MATPSRKVFLTGECGSRVASSQRVHGGVLHPVPKSFASTVHGEVLPCHNGPSSCLLGALPQGVVHLTQRLLEETAVGFHKPGLVVCRGHRDNRLTNTQPARG